MICPYISKKGCILKCLFSVGFNSCYSHEFQTDTERMIPSQELSPEVSNPNCTVQRQHSSNSSARTVSSAFQGTSSYSQHLKFPPLQARGYPTFLKYSMREESFKQGRVPTDRLKGTFWKCQKIVPGICQGHFQKVPLFIQWGRPKPSHVHTHSNQLPIFANKGLL